MPYVIAILSAAMFSAIIYGGGTQSLSADLPHHYALVATLAQDGDRVATAPHLGEMGYYPALTHWLAVYAGRLSGMGPLLGLIGVSVASVAVTYAAIFALTAFSGAYVAMFSAAALITAALTGAHLSALSGYELVHNFLYSQLVAQALGWAGMLALFLIRKKVKPWQRDIVALILVFILAYGHLLPALHLTATYGLILLGEIWEDRRQYLRLILYSAAGLAALLLHPSFSAMAKIANHDGALTFGFTGLWGAHTIILCFSLAVSGLVYLTGYRSLRWLACAGIAISVLASLQMIALRLGYGSPYAVKKYFFTIYTLLVIQIGALLGAIVQWVSSPHLPAAPAFSAAFGFLMLALTIAPARYDNRKVEQVAEFAHHFATYHHPANPQGVVIVNSKSLYSVLNYMLSLGVLRHPKDTPNSLAILSGKDLPEPQLVAYAIVDQTDDRFPRKCSLSEPVSPKYRVVDMRCVAAGGAYPL